MIDRYHDIPCNAANCYSLTHKHTLSLFLLHSEVHYSRDTRCPDALLCFAILCSALQPEYMVMSSSPVLRTRCLTGQLDAYSFTKMYFQTLSSSLPSPKKALCRPPSQHVRARARGNLGGKTRRRRIFWPATFLRCPSFLSSVFPFSHHHPTPPIQTPQPKPLILSSPSPSFQSNFKFQISKIQFTNLHIPNPAQTTLVPTTATFLGNTPNLDPERIIVPDCSRSCFIPE